MSYLAPSEFVTKMVDAGESKIFMSTRDTLIRAYMAGAILALAAVFAVTVTVSRPGMPLVGAHPVPGRLLHALPAGLRPADRRVRAGAAGADRQAPGRHARAACCATGAWCSSATSPARFTVAVLMAIIFTFGFTTEPNAVGKVIAHIGESAHPRLRGARPGRHAHALRPRHAVQLDGVDRRRRRDDLHSVTRQGDRDVDADHGVLLHDVRALDREHVPVPVGPAAWARNSPGATTSSGTRSRPCWATWSAACVHRPDAVLHPRARRRRSAR